MKSSTLKFIAATLVGATALAGFAQAEEDARVQAVADGVVPMLMKEHGIPGMAIGIVTPDGRHVLNYGVASRQDGAPVGPETLFEVGSISKSFTATLASYATVKGHLSLTDSVADHMPELAGSPLGEVDLLALGTHTPGGMPLQFPDDVTDDESLTAFFKAWQPDYAPGTYRTYANPSIGLLGVVTAASMGGDFVTLMQETLYLALGLQDTYLEVPESAAADYAQGYSSADEPTRMSPGVLDSEAYGVRTTAADIVRFVEANMGRVELEADLQQAIDDTHTGYYELGAMTQDLIWEQYDYPVALEDLVAGNSRQVSQQPNRVTAIAPALAPRKDVLINKTGSTRGFSAYVAFVPERELGVVLLANKSYPMEARVTAGHAILRALDDETAD